jgi:NADPH:quinone reductase-like Zn-dependent oxidoreductase
MSTTATSTTVIAREKENREKTKVIHPGVSNTLAENEIRLRVDKLGLTANNKFYMDFGEQPSFHFNAAYPTGDETLVNIPAWGLATVIESNVPDVPVGQTYRGFLQLADTIQFPVTPSENGGFNVVRDKVHVAYNSFVKVSSALASANDTESDIALVTWPGFVTGYGLCQQLVRRQYYGASTVILTSASSKVSLAASYFLKQQGNVPVKIIGYTSASNKDFCIQTGLYDDVVTYDDTLETNEKCVLIDVAGNGSLYHRLQPKLIKVLAVGNSNDISEESSTFKQFSWIGTMKLIMTFMGMSNWFRSWLNPQLELFFVFDIMQELKQELGQAKLDVQMDAAMKEFVDAIITNKWMTVRTCDSLESIQQAHVDICKGNVKPSEAVVVDMDTAAKKSSN